jgi:hypothetical protein
MLTWLSNISVWAYSILLLAYPPAFRWEYGEEMMQLFRDMLQDSIRRRGCLGILEVWFCVLPDWVITVRQQRLMAGSYYRSKWILIVAIQVIIAMIFLGFGFVYWLY